MTERWAAALCAGGILTAYQVERRADDETERLDTLLARIRKNSRDRDQRRWAPWQPGDSLRQPADE